MEEQKTNLGNENVNNNELVSKRGTSNVSGSSNTNNGDNAQAVSNNDNVIDKVAAENQNTSRKASNTTEEKQNTGKKAKKKRSKIGKVFRAISTTLLIAMVILVITILVRVLVMKKYDLFGYRLYLIVSGSMSPTIEIGDAVITKEQPIVNEGDIIAFEEHGSYTIHRVMSKYEENGEIYYKTKGDANNAEDVKPAWHNNVEGVVVSVIPWLGKLLRFIVDNIVYICFGIVFILLIVIVRRLI